MANLKNTNIDDTGFLKLPAGTTAQQPISPQSGMVRFNQNDVSLEIYDANNQWKIAQRPIVPIQATGGEIRDWLIENVIYRVHAFKSTGTSTFNVTNAGNYGKIDVLVVAGGGNGGARRGGGGGAGGVVFKPNHPITATSYSIVVGAGGAPVARFSGIQNNGQNSTAFGLTAIGGGAGGNGASGNANGLNGGSGGGGSIPAGSSTQTTFTGAFSFGNNGGNGVSGDNTGGGGGGAGAPGQPAQGTRQAGNGGIGVNFSHVFTANYGEEGFFGGGGGGSMNDNSTPRQIPGAGGKGGGGAGAYGNAITFGGGSGNINPPMAGFFRPYNGLPNTGGGGGGTNSNTTAADAWVAQGFTGNGGGGSGIVLIRYPIEIIYN